MAEIFSRISESEYSYSITNQTGIHASDNLKEDFDINGYVIVRNLFSQTEISKLYSGIENWQEFWDASFSVSDSATLKHDLSAWCEPGNDSLGMACKTVKVLQVAEDLLNRGEIYLYSGKVIMKKPHTGGGLLWHQDYGYWYKNRCLFPDFVTCLIALTKSNQNNGGLEVLKGSHRCGRVDHSRVAGQTGADLERVALIEKVLPKVNCDLMPGDGIFFHGNILHKSEANLSDEKRWHLIFCYNAKHNSPDKPHYNAQYSKPLEKLPPDALAKLENLKLQPRQFVLPQYNKNIST